MFTSRANFVQVGQKIVDTALGGFLKQNFTIANDRIQGCSQFMTHIGEECAFCDVGSLGGLFLASKFYFRMATLSNIAGGEDNTGNVAILIKQQIRNCFKPDKMSQ